MLTQEIVDFSAVVEGGEGIRGANTAMEDYTMPTLKCHCCTKNIPKTGRRVCPECGHVFQGKGWYGIASHWRLRHYQIMSYEEFWTSLCDDHRAEERNTSVTTVPPSTPFLASPKPESGNRQ